jgi:hypothetical protein
VDPITASSSARTTANGTALPVSLAAMAVSAYRRAVASSCGTGDQRYSSAPPADAATRPGTCRCSSGSSRTTFPASGGISAAPRLGWACESARMPRAARSMYRPLGVVKPNARYSPCASEVCSIQRNPEPGPSSIIVRTRALPSPAPR